MANSGIIVANYFAVVRSSSHFPRNIFDVLVFHNLVIQHKLKGAVMPHHS